MHEGGEVVGRALDEAPVGRRGEAGDEVQAPHAEIGAEAGEHGVAAVGLPQPVGGRLVGEVEHRRHVVAVCGAQRDLARALAAQQVGGDGELDRGRRPAGVGCVASPPDRTRHPVGEHGRQVAVRADRLASVGGRGGEPRLLGAAPGAVDARRRGGRCCGRGRGGDGGGGGRRDGRGGESGRRRRCRARRRGRRTTGGGHETHDDRERSSPHPPRRPRPPVSGRSPPRQPNSALRARPVAIGVGRGPRAGWGWGGGGRWVDGSARARRARRTAAPTAPPNRW